MSRASPSTEHRSSSSCFLAVFLAASLGGCGVADRLAEVGSPPKMTTIGDVSRDRTLPHKTQAAELMARSPVIGQPDVLASNCFSIVTHQAAAPDPRERRQSESKDYKIGRAHV